jgi:hypothetical protein
MIARVVLAALLAAAARAEDDGPLGLADLAAEHAAVTGRGASTEPPEAVGFRALWDHPESWRGRRVIVRGRIARVFRQAAFGGFPPLVEAWIEEPPGNLFCAVYSPAANGPREVAAGASVAFTGTFLRRLRYAADDGDRLAPLIVGPEPPRVEARPPALPLDFRTGAPASAWTDSTWGVGLFVGLAAVAALLAWRTLSGPVPIRRGRRSTAADPEPQFLDRRREPADGDSR